MRHSLCTLVLAGLLAGACCPAGSLATHAAAVPHGGQLPANAEEIEAPKFFDLQAIDRYVAAQIERQGFVGLGLAIVKDGRIVLEKAYGKGSLASGARLGTDTPFAVGSITKQFTCASMLLLAEEGKLSPQDPVAKYYPELTRAADVTLYDLGTHVSGYPDYYPLDFLDRRMMKPVTLAGLVRQYGTLALDFEPGTRWSYSNTGFVILGGVIEKASGMPFAELLAQRIFKPLGMAHAVLDPRKDRVDLAQGHTAFAMGEAERATLEADGWLFSAGGLYATASDLAKWDLGLIDGKVLKPESLQLMLKPRALANGRTTDYGCGLGIRQIEGETVVRHMGAVSGFLAYNAMVPRTRSAVVLLSNADHLDPGPLHEQLLKLVLQRPDEVPRVRGPLPKDVALDLLHQLQAGTLDRSKLGAELGIYLSDERVGRAAPRLKALGEPTSVEVESLSERGGMEVAAIRFVFEKSGAEALLYRTPDGKIQEFLLYQQ
jgi:D-alanyl-D-alanine carboxypeptidase